MSGVATVGPFEPLPAAVVVPVTSGDFGRRTLLVGTGHRATRLARTLVDTHGRHIVGAVDVLLMPDLPSEMPLVPWLGSVANIEALALEHRVDEICVALPLRSCFDEWRQAQAVGRELGIPVSFHFDLMGDGSRVQVAHSGDAQLLRCGLHPASLGAAPLVKRVFDVIVASTMLLALSPILLLAALLVKATSPGPIFFKQPRVGRGRRVFGMFKFRTMVADAEKRRSEVAAMNDASGILFKIIRDPRLTSVGPLLRRTSIDELPQLFNVLRGEMSLIGPRPLPTWACEQLEEPSFNRRYSVQPGMTGLWQVHGRPQEFKLMWKYDLQYVERWSFLLDLWILARTIPAVLKRQGAQ
jgi:exopolysaccharide biosynthesis polyprenyl glycosylphosphotransferase